jgi:hypothetical protein
MSDQKTFELCRDALQRELEVIVVSSQFSLLGATCLSSP